MSKPAESAGFGVASARRPASVTERVLQAAATVCLAVLVLASGFLMCAVPPQTTELLAGQFSIANARTGFTHADMVAVASATRDYSFGSHNKTALLQAIYNANVNGSANAALIGRSLSGAPTLANVDRSDPGQIEAALASANERFVYTPEAISHLDDCHNVAVFAYALVGVVAVTFAISIAVLHRRGRTRLIGRSLTVAGAIVLALFCVLGVWALADFNGLFTVFHEVFFSQGNWTFPTDSLLICALPTEFWMGMGAVWLATTVIASILVILIGRFLTRPRRSGARASR